MSSGWSSEGSQGRSRRNRRRSADEDRNRELGRVQAENLGKLAVLANDLANSAVTPESGRLVVRCADWLRKRGQRLTRWSEGVASKIPLARLRLLCLQFERSLENLRTAEVYHDPEEIQMARAKLRELLSLQQKRELYDDLVMVLRQLAMVMEECAAESGDKSSYLEMAGLLEARLEAGALDRVATDQRARDSTLLKQFERRLEILERDLPQ